MKSASYSATRSLMLLCLLSFHLHTLAAQDYFWVGGPGKWSEFSTHWAKIPNPAVAADFHANVPTSGNDVYFTGNASPFTAYVAGTAYTLDVDAGSTVPKCRDMDWTGVPAGTVWGGGGGRMDIYGSLTMDANMSMTFNNEIHFISNDAATKQIWSKTVHFSGPVYFEGTDGGWQFMDDIYFNEYVAHTGGLIETNNQKVTIGSTFYGNDNAVHNGQLHLGSSEMLISGNAFFKYTALQFDAGTSHIKMVNANTLLDGPNYYSASLHFYDVSFLSDYDSGGFAWGFVDGTLTFHGRGRIHGYSNGVVPVLNEVIFLQNAHIYNAFKYNHLTLTAGKTYTFQDYGGTTGTDQTILPGGSLTALGAGTCSQFITIKSWQYGTAVNFVNNSGATQTVHCGILEDIHATGSSPLELIDGVDLGNNTGWIFTNPHPGIDLYWVGGAGNWNDPCHWTTNSAGTVGDCACIPNGASNVHFTANSGFMAGSTVVNVPIDAYCKDMDWTGVTGMPKLFLPNNIQLNVYGAATLAPPSAMTLEYNNDPGWGSKFRFRGHGTHTVTTAGQFFDHYTIFEGTGAYLFGDDFNSKGGVVHLNGQLKTMGFAVNIEAWDVNINQGTATYNPNTELWLGNPGTGASSTLTLSNVHYGFDAHFHNDYLTGKFHAMQSHIIVNGSGGNRIKNAYTSVTHDYWKVTFTSGTFERGNILDKLTFTSRGNIDVEGFIHEVEFYENGQIRGNHSFDLITIRGGYFYQLFSGNTQTINAGGTINVLNADCAHLAYLYTDSPIATAKIAKIGGSLILQHVVLDNVLPDLSTGATYSATNSVGIQPQVQTDWNMTNPAPRNLFWVGGSGIWHDSNHWSLASGGAGGECPPTPQDNVRFDAASGLGAGSVVDVTQVWAFCKDMDWTGVTGGAKFYTVPPPYTPNQIAVFGSLTFSSGMENDFAGSFWMRANGPATITSAGKKFQKDLLFWNPDGQWSLLDELSNVVPGNAVIGHFFGDLNTNNHNITTCGWNTAGYTADLNSFISAGKLTLGSSKLRVWAAPGYNSLALFFMYPSANFNAGTSEIILENTGPNNIVSSGGYSIYPQQTFYDITIKGTGGLYGGQVDGRLLLKGAGFVSDGGPIKTLEFQGDGNFINNSSSTREVNSVKFAPGKRYTFQSNFYLDIVPMSGTEGQFIAQGLPGQYIEIKSSNPAQQATIHMDDYNGTSTCTKYLFLTGMTHTGTEDIYVPTPGGNVFNNAGWQFFPCNPCPASIPVLDATASRTATCVPGTAVLVLAGLKPDEWANWYTDPAAMTNLVYSGGATGPAGNRFEPSITGPVTYYARVYSDGGLCESTVILSVNVTIVSPPAAFNVTGGGTVCVGGDGAPIGLSGSESGVDYQLKINGVASGSPVAGTGSALAFGNQTAPGTYTVMASLPGTNCMVTMSGSAIVVGSQATAPAVEPGSNGPFCEGTVDFDLILYPGTSQDVIGWQWSGPNGFTSTDQQPIIFGPTPANSGIYTLIVTGINGCTNEATTEYIEIYPQPETRDDCDLARCEETPGSGTATFDLTEREACLTLEADGVEVTYYTDAGLNNEIQMPTEFISGTTTVYALITSSSHGCTVTTTMQLTVNPLPLVSITPANAAACAPATVNLFAGQGFDTYLWSPGGETDPFIAAASSGTYTVQVSSAAGCTNTASKLVTIYTPPTLTCPQNKTVDLTDPAFALTGGLPAGGAYTGTGVNAGTFTPLSAGVGARTITYAYTDGNGCPGSCTFTITVQSLLPPSIICPMNIARNTDLHQCSAVVSYPPPTVSGSGMLTLMLTSDPATASGSAFPKGVTMVNWKVTDPGGNMAICNFTVTVADAQAPSITCPANILKATDPNLCTAAVLYPMPVSSDNCSVAAVVLTSGPATASGSAFGKTTTTVSWKATDGSGNMSTCAFTVTVYDNQPPGISCPANMTKNTAPNTCGAVVTYSATATDNCMPPFSVTTQSGIPSGMAFPKGVTTVVMKATDGAGLTKTCSFKVTVNDQQPPSITCPQSISTTTTAGQCTSLPVTYTTPTATDNCMPPGPALARLTGFASGQPFPEGATVVVWRATDASGLTATCSFTVTVNDLTPPVITCPPNISTTGSVINGACVAVVAFPNATATDNCEVTSVILTVGLASYSVFPLGVTTDVWRATDDVGNTSTCWHTVTVDCGAGPSGAGNEQRTTNNEQQITNNGQLTTNNGQLTTNNEQRTTMTLSPNPASSQVTITLENLDESGGYLSVFDAQGRVVWQQKAPVQQEQVVIDLSNRWAAGLYTVALRSGGEVLTKRLIVQR